jgi:hypothetical protein
VKTERREPLYNAGGNAISAATMETVRRFLKN